MPPSPEPKNLPEHCDFELASEMLRDMLMVGRQEAAQKEQDLLLKKEFADALASFLQRPSRKTAILLLKVAPMTYSYFEESSPGGLFYESRRELNQMTLHFQTPEEAEEFKRIVTDKLPPPMNEFSLPKELLVKCYGVVENTHRKIGISKLPAMIETEENVVAVVLVPEMRNVMQNAKRAFRLRWVCWAGLGLSIVLGWVFNWWMLSAGVVAVVVERRLAFSETRM